ncbi:uncharacterized protein LOC142228886 [Haematobia irritans]|uniref:uncharacterized protein LOC142228886 n=1 Tax=Haematobia irritans TaxID=7368 RepID=UPI003F50C351
MIKAVKDLKDLSNTADENIANSGESLADNTEIPMDLSMPLDSTTSIRCDAHTLQLWVNDVLKTNDIKDRLDQFRLIVKKLRTQTYLNPLKSSGFKVPILDCATRWNSTYLMLERLTDLKRVYKFD